MGWFSLVPRPETATLGPGNEARGGSETMGSRMSNYLTANGNWN